MDRSIPDNPRRIEKMTIFMEELFEFPLPDP